MVVRKPEIESILTQEMCNELLSYDPLTGNLYWKKRDIKWFDPEGYGGQEGNCNRWNAQNAGKPALQSLSKSKDSFCGAIFGHGVAAHRIVFFMHYGWWPDVVTHKNENKLDNRIENLIASDKEQTVRSGKTRKSNTSGVNGVHLVKKTGMWTAVINLGSFDTLEEAIAKRKWADTVWDYHKNHGRDEISNAN